MDSVKFDAAHVIAPAWRKHDREGGVDVNKKAAA